MQVLCACAKVRESDPEVILRGISEGLDSPDERIRSESCAALVTVYSSARYKNAVAEAVVLQELVVPAIMGKLRDDSKLVVGTASQALAAVRQRAPDAFNVILMQLPADMQKLYASVSGGSGGGGASNGADGMHSTSSSSATSSPPTVPSSARPSKQRESSSGGGGGGDSLQFGFVPARLMTDLQVGFDHHLRISLSRGTLPRLETVKSEILS